jgi:hypothetical protein
VAYDRTLSLNTWTATAKDEGKEKRKAKMTQDEDVNKAFAA